MGERGNRTMQGVNSVKDFSESVSGIVPPALSFVHVTHVDGRI